jgi:membrane protein required for colicin V production
LNTLDMIVIGVVVLSGLFAFVRGFVREALSILAWIVAGAVAYYGFDSFKPTVEHFVSNPLAAQVVTGGVLFVVSLLVFSVVVGMLSSRVRASSLGSVDRSLGLLFGLARGALVICLAYLVTAHLIAPGHWPPKPEELPPWIAQASLRPYLESGATALAGLIPGKILDKGTNAAATAGQKLQDAAQAGGLATQASDALKNAQDSFEALRQPPQPQQQQPQQPATGYTDEQKREMNRVFEQKTNGAQ